VKREIINSALYVNEDRLKNYLNMCNRFRIKVLQFLNYYGLKGCIRSEGTQRATGFLIGEDTWTGRN
jgi:hypothetical protein